MVDVETNLLFGSLSEVLDVQNAVREIFKTKDVTVLHENAVISGAVHIRHATGCQTRADIATKSKLYFSYYNGTLILKLYLAPKIVLI